MMWLGEQVTEKGIGNGISMLIFAGIVAGLPGAVGQAFESARKVILNIVAVGVLFYFACCCLVCCTIERGQRRITVNYAKRQQGKKVYAAQTQPFAIES